MFAVCSCVLSYHVFWRFQATKIFWGAILLNSTTVMLGERFDFRSYIVRSITPPLVKTKWPRLSLKLLVVGLLSVPSVPHWHAWYFCSKSTRRRRSWSVVWAEPALQLIKCHSLPWRSETLKISGIYGESIRTNMFEGWFQKCIFQPFPNVEFGNLAAFPFDVDHPVSAGCVIDVLLPAGVKVSANHYFLTQST